MKADWPVAALQDASVEIIDGDRGSNYPAQSDFKPTGYCLFLNAGNVTKDGFNFSDCMFISAEKDAALRKGKLQRHDVVLTTRGTVGNVAYFDESVPFQHVRLNSGMVIFRAAEHRLLSRFLYFFFRSRSFREQVSSLRTGSAQPQLPIRDINRIKIPIPPIQQQRLIAEMLGALDDKIKLNRRINETLEEIARSIFKSWFVEPDSCAKWHLVKLSEVCEYILSGGTPSTKAAAYWNGNVPWLSSGETRSRFICGTDKKITQEGIDNSSARFARQGCTVIASAGQGHTRGQTSLLMIDTYINQSVIALAANQHVISDLFLFFDLERRYDEFRRISDSQSSRGSLTTKLLGNLAVTVPPRELVAKFDATVKPLVERIRLLLEENATLTSLRDHLLPKLMSGTIRIKDAEKIVEARA